MSLPSGHKIGSYQVVAPLGAGGMGEVYRAKDSKLGREVALKVLPAHLANDADYMARFHREAHVLASLNHPNIATIHGLEANAIVMELVEGETLAERIKRGALPLEEALPIAHQIVNALEAAHEKGIIHRDLKPANIKVTPDGTVKLLDFGLAKAMETTAAPADENSPTQTLSAMASMPGTIMGTASYMSPEQARGARMDHRTDIWAFGVVLFEMVTQRSLFKGETVSDTIAAILRSDPDIDAAPASLRPLLRRCLERNPRQRLGWIGEVRVAFDAKPESPSRWRTAAAVMAVVAVGALLALAATSYRAVSTETGPAIPRPVMLTTDGRSGFPALSPDGKLVAYLSRTEDRKALDLRLRQVSGGASSRLAVSAAPVRPAFSADGSRVYFTSFGNATDGSRSVHEVSVLGGEAQLLFPGVRQVFPSPDGKWLAYLKDERIHLRPAQGGEESVIDATFEPFTSLVWSADSRRVMATSFRAARFPQLATIEVEGSRVSNLDTRALKINLESRGFGDLNVLRMVAWLPGGEAVMSIRYGDATNLWRVRLDDPGAAPIPITAALRNNADGVISGNRVVVSNSQLAEQIWSLPADTNRGKVLGEPSPVTPDGVTSEFQAIHPDGSQLLYISEKFGAQGMFVQDLKTGKERVLFQARQMSGHSIWSPDGRQVAFFMRGGQWPAYVIPASGGSPRKLGESGGRLRGWSKDGRHLLVWRVAEPANTLGVLDTANGTYTTILSSAKSRLSDGRLSPDGKWVAFVSGNPEGETTAHIAPFRGAQSVPESEWIPIADGGGYVFWAPDSHSLYFRRGGAFHRQPLDAAARPAGPAEEFYRLDTFRLASPVTNTVVASRDRIFFISFEGRSDIWMTELR